MVVSSGAVTPRALEIAEVAGQIAREQDRTASQIALAWLLGKPGIVAPILGARTPQQFVDNLAALEITLTPQQVERLDAASAIELGFPHDYLAWLMSSAYMGRCMPLIARPRGSGEQHETTSSAK